MLYNMICSSTNLVKSLARLRRLETHAKHTTARSGNLEPCVSICRLLGSRAMATKKVEGGGLVEVVPLSSIV